MDSKEPAIQVHACLGLSLNPSPLSSTLGVTKDKKEELNLMQSGSVYEKSGETSYLRASMLKVSIIIVGNCKNVSPDALALL